MDTLGLNRTALVWELLESEAQMFDSSGRLCISVMLLAGWCLYRWIVGAISLQALLLLGGNSASSWNEELERAPWLLSAIAKSSGAFHGELTDAQVWVTLEGRVSSDSPLAAA